MHPEAERWASAAFGPYEWEPDPTNIAQPGEAGGFFVRAVGHELKGYLKPTTPNTAGRFRAANEKIVADLATAAGIFVPPVILYRRTTCPKHQESLVCVSLVCFEEVYELEKVVGATPAALALAKGALARTCGVLALDVLVANQDRGGARNAVFGISNSSPSDAAYFYIDYAFSMNSGDCWEKDAWRNATLPAVHDLLRGAVDKKVLRDALQRVESISDATFETIVGRIPSEYMPAAHADLVIAGLKGRRALVPGVLAQAFGL